MATTPREWPNNCITVRDGVAELIRSDIKNLELISTNEINDEEQIEAVVAKVISDQYLLLRALETVGASTSPINELNNRVLELKGKFSFARA
ncbi:MAG: hypothetical protein FD147_2597 [Chloroflexi bacterium]|nr:MAG: hypothetical protein FD147_2597 [Chloroflexota bacterium]MBA4375806.1 hypothetical protein [Anaerolinea sp.]